MTVTSNLNAGILSIAGDTFDNAITASRDAAGNILVDDGAVPTTGSAPTVTNTNLIQISGSGGNDVIGLDESHGALPAAKLLGGDGDDILTGGSGNDQLFGEAGNDRMIWNPGNGTELFEGGADNDTAEINGGDAAEVFTIANNGTRVRFDRTSPAPFSLDIGTTENLVLHAGGGDDTITAGNGLAALIALTLDGGDGNDTITGGDGADVLIGGAGNDIVTGGRGNDTALLGDGDDTFVWNPGDGSDTVEGQGGIDTLIFNGSNAAENIDISANGSRIRLSRDVAAITMDVNGVEKIALKALGGADTITVNDLTGTGVQQVAVDLTAGGAGDGAADTVIVNGSGNAEHITVALSGSTILVNGTPVQVTISGQEAANDKLAINGSSGADVIDASALPAGQINLTINGGDGNDVITGSGGDDTINSGNNNDTVTGGAGSDLVLLGGGDDIFIWNPGDGSDQVQGQGGLDTLVFNGSNAAENIDISANGGNARLTRDVGSVAIDLNSVEKIVVHATGGADTVSVDDLTGTGVQQVAIDLSAAGGGGDGQADTVNVGGTAATDHIIINQSGQTILVDGLPAEVAISGQEATDTLVVNGLGGADVIDASSLAAGQVSLVINGGDGADVILGSAGNDLVDGGRDNDVAFLGAGDDTFVWNPGEGSDIVDGQTGFDTLNFNGSNAAEHVDISANGSSVRFFRDVANVTMDLHGMEKIVFHALGGADTITVNDLTGTDVRQVAIDLTATGGVGDGQADTVIVNAGNDADQIAITQSGQNILVNSLAAQTSINGQEAANDTLQVNGLGGADSIDASALAAGQIKLAIDGGAGNDVITGSAGNDLLTGGADDDLFIYRPGGAADTITDFVAGAGTVDRIDLKAFASAGIHNIDDVLAHATQVGADTVVDFGGGDSLTLQNVAKTSLSADDFVFKAPSVTSVTTSGTGITAGSGDLNAGHLVTFTLTLDEAVTVTGGPVLLLNDGGTASFTGGSGSNVLTFQYLVQSPENTNDLSVTATQLHGGTIHDQSGNDADLSGAVTNPAGTLQIDTTAPHVTNIAASPGNGAEVAGSLVSFTLAFDETVHVTGATPTLALNDGGTAVFDAAATILLGDHSKLVFDYIVSANDSPTTSLAVTGLNPHSATIDDLANNHADLSHVAATFNGLAVNQPSVTPVDPPPVVTGGPSPVSSGAIGGRAQGLDLTHLSPAADLHSLSDFHLL